MTAPARLSNTPTGGNLRCSGKRMTQRDDQRKNGSSKSFGVRQDGKGFGGKETEVQGPKKASKGLGRKTTKRDIDPKNQLKVRRKSTLKRNQNSSNARKRESGLHK